MKLRMSRYVVWSSLCAGLTAVSLGNGFRLPDQDAESVARGEAFVATADNPSAVYYNPAGITQLEGQNVRLGGYGLAFTSTYKSPTGGSFDTKSSLHVIPQAFYTYSAESLPISLGLGFYAPYGLGVEWPQDTGFRTKALSSDMVYMTLNPVVAWRILTNLSIAVGPTINYSTLTLKQGITPIPNFDLLTLKGNATAYGFNAGIMWQPHPKVSLGAVYRARTEMDYDGSTTTEFVLPVPGYPQYLKMDATTKVPFPQSVAAGISFRPTPKWNIEFDVDWTDWNQVGTLYVQQLMPQSLALNWQSSFYYEVGATYHIDNAWHVSAGWIYNENSTPNATTYTPLVPDQNRQFISVGVGYRYKHFSIDVAYQYGFGQTLTVTGNQPSAAGQTANGQFDYTHNNFAVSAGWHF